MIGYDSASVGDAVPWCSLGAAHKHIALVEAATRSSERGRHVNRYKILVAELTGRNEWVIISQAEPQLTLSDIIELVAQRHSIWHVTSELKGGQCRGWASKQKQTNPYDAESSWRSNSRSDWGSQGRDPQRDLVT